MHHLITLALRALLALSTGLLLVGCATAPKDAPSFSAAPPAPDGYATVYIYRLGAPPLTREIKVTLGGKPIMSATEQGYTWVHVRAGTYTLFAQWHKEIFGGGWPDATSTKAFEAGKNYYFRVAGNIEPTKGGGFFSGSGGFMLTSMVLPRTPAEGEAELAACCRFVRSSTERID